MKPRIKEILKSNFEGSLIEINAFIKGALWADKNPIKYMQLIQTCEFCFDTKKIDCECNPACTNFMTCYHCKTV